MKKLAAESRRTCSFPFQRGKALPAARAARFTHMPLA
jgi:hypothetical protein